MQRFINRVVIGVNKIQKMKKYFLLLVFTAVFSVQGFTCSCFPVGYHFCETLANDTSIASVVMVQKLNDYHYGMRVKLIQHISGEPVADTVIVWGDNGALCRLGTGGWGIGDTIIMALHHADLSGNIIYNPDYPPNLENTQDYHVSGCGVYALNVLDGQVIGYINQNSMQIMNITSFLAVSCVYILNTEDPEIELTVSIYPNPASDLVSITIANHLNETFQISIINALGEVVMQSFYQPNLPLNIHPLNNGLYTVIIRSHSIQKCIKLLKQE
jgi:hypothetical protein